MSETLQPPVEPVTGNERAFPAICYALYLLALSNGITAVLGLILAYVKRDGASPAMTSHYTWLIRTFWISLIVAAIGVMVVIVAVPLSLILIGIPLFFAGWLIVGLAGALAVLRTVLGVIKLAQNQPYPRPYAIIA